MTYQEERSRYGKTMFSFTFKVSKFLMRNMWLYYILNYTWGSIMTTIGWFAFFIVSLFLSEKPINCAKFGPCYYVFYGDNWGGLSLGTNFILADNMGDEWTHHTKEHECGHTFQNAILGPFAIFLVFIPSFIRYWYQSIRMKKGKTNKPYDSIWFEGSASTIGNYYYNNFLKK